MKKIEIIIQHAKIDEVITALEKAGAHGMTVSEVRGFGRQRGHREVYRGESREVRFLPKVKVEIVAHDNAVAAIIETVMQAARTGEVGDGKIWVLPVEDAFRIRTGEHGDAAL